jgi:hypothetical protein
VTVSSSVSSRIVLLSHSDRARLIRHGRNVLLLRGNGGTAGTVLVDGFYAAAWKITRHEGAATLRIAPFATVTKTHAARLRDEGARLLAFVAPDDERRTIEVTPSHAM